MDVDLGALGAPWQPQAGAEQVSDVGVDATVRDQTTAGADDRSSLRASAGADDGVHLVHLADPEGLIDANAVLPDDTTGTDVQMTDLTVTHEALRQADCERGGFELSISLGSLGVGTGEGRHERGIGGGDGITLGGRMGAGDAPAIDHDWSDN